MLLPLLTLPFITLGFWTLGGGKGEVLQQKPEQGLNAALPGAHLGQQPQDKMGVYAKAAKDSAGKIPQLSFESFMEQDSMTTAAWDTTTPSTSVYSGGIKKDWTTGMDPNEIKVRSGLQRLEEAISSPLPQSKMPDYSPLDHTTDENLGRLEAMMQSVTASPGPDTEMQQINDVLENILDIQNPGRVQQKLKEQSLKNRGRVYAVSKPQLETTAAYLSNGAAPYGAQLVDSGTIPVYEPSPARNAFYDLPTADYETNEETAIPAAIHGTQTLVNGSTVKMRILEDILINGVTVPQGTFIYGNCAISGERLKIEIPGIRYGKNVYPVAMIAFALDAIEGIPIPGTLNRDAAKEGADRTLQSMQLMSLDPSIATQAAGAGVEVAKGLFGKKAKLVRVTVKADYPILLMDEKTLQDNH